MAMSRTSYTLEEARALLPEIRAMLLQLAVERHRYQASHVALHRQRRGDADGDRPAAALDEAAMSTVRAAMRALLNLLEDRGIEVRDLDDGLVDIPTERNGEPAWFCWRLSDPELAFWHTRHEGFASRRPL